MNLPNTLAGSRIFLTFVIMALLFAPYAAAKAVALALFFVAAATDWLDGFLARRLRQTTPLGALLDPIADKVLVIGLLLTFVQLRLVAAWMVLVIILRELLITGVRLYAVSRGIVIPAAREGKHKTLSQMLTLTIVLGLLAVRAFLSGDAAVAFEMRMIVIIHWCMWLTVVLTVYSGGIFFWRNRALFVETSHGK